MFLFSVYPVSESLRRWAGQPSALLVASWAIMLIEVAFPLALAHVMALKIALGVALAFHIGNACLFGLNRFVWAWVAAYPSLLWFQQELVTRLFDPEIPLSTPLETRRRRRTPSACTQKDSKGGVAGQPHRLRRQQHRHGSGPRMAGVADGSVPSGATRARSPE